ncbi:MAG: site-specific integrase [Proteobacteria bacterium]|nr:site-specific integrase [Pseudomonadota bacterium]MBS0598875.1 site-specific integrase [Pseudomonadota bacterium]
MADIDTYLEAATRASTKRTYAGAVRHFEVEAGRPLPATGEQVAQYLADYAGQLAVPTLRHRLAALAQWHRDQGFADPTKTPIVRKVFRGIRTLHPRLERQATPLQLVHLGRVADALDHAVHEADAACDAGAALRHRRDRALVLLGFWRAFRGDELLRLQAEHVQIDPGKGMTCFLPQSKGDRENLGRTCKVPALTRWCPVGATTDWLAASGLTSGPLLRPINRWGQLGEGELHPNSFVPLLRSIFTDAGLPAPAGYSGHSLRRGFAGWAESQGWDLKSLMDYVGWRDVQSAMRYLEPDPFARLRGGDDQPKRQSAGGSLRATGRPGLGAPQDGIEASVD